MKKESEKVAGKKRAVLSDNRIASWKALPAKDEAPLVEFELEFLE
ncbi:MAG: hypothetical protein ACXWMS_10895 [Syntrophales bacterium]